MVFELRGAPFWSQTFRFAQTDGIKIKNGKISDQKKDEEREQNATSHASHINYSLPGKVYKYTD